MTPLIELVQLSKIYFPGENQIHALNKISLSVYEGDFVAIIGQSGSGKSTLMNIIGCLDQPTQGDYLLNGENVSNLSDDRQSEIRNQQIGFIFQGFNLIASLDALENVELPLIYRGMDKETRRKISTEALRQVGLEARMRHRPVQLSGGQQQRVAIARAIAAKPPILLADEPTGNLDSRSGSEVISILKQLNDQGRTIVLITHDNAIAQTARRLIRITDGCIESDELTSYS